MSRDYAKKRPRPQATAPRSQVPAWVWLFTGSVLGAFVMFLVYLAGIPAQPGRVADALEQSAEPAETEEAKPQPRFDFYQLLKESEVVVNPEPVPTRDATKPAEKVEYILQVGSFKSPGDADRLRAELLLLNLDARVETVRVRNAEVWHRVLVGPFSSHASMSKARGTLGDNRMETLLLKRSAEG